MWWLVIPVVIISGIAFNASAEAAYGARRFCDAFEGTEAQQEFVEDSKKSVKKTIVSEKSEKQARAIGQCRELLAAGISNRRVKLDPKSTQLCLKSRAVWLSDPEQGSTLKTSMMEACDRAIIGQQKLSDPCDSAFECAVGLVCVGNRGGPPGTCRRPLALNTTCDDSQVNASELHAIIAAMRPSCGANAYCGTKNGVLVCLPD